MLITSGANGCICTQAGPSLSLLVVLCYRPITVIKPCFSISPLTVAVEAVNSIPIRLQ
jgi:hypothetical protein